MDPTLQAVRNEYAIFLTDGFGISLATWPQWKRAIWLLTRHTPLEPIEDSDETVWRTVAAQWLCDDAVQLALCRDSESRAVSPVSTVQNTMQLEGSSGNVAVRPMQDDGHTESLPPNPPRVSRFGRTIVSKLPES